MNFIKTIQCRACKEDKPFLQFPNYCDDKGVKHRDNKCLDCHKRSKRLWDFSAVKEEFAEEIEEEDMNEQARLDRASFLKKAKRIQTKIFSAIVW